MLLMFPTNIIPKILVKSYIRFIFLTFILQNGVLFVFLHFKILSIRTKRTKKNMEKDAITVMMNHRSIRKFTDEKVDEALLSEILECGLRASNTGNM